MKWVNKFSGVFLGCSLVVMLAGCGQIATLGNQSSSNSGSNAGSGHKVDPKNLTIAVVPKSVGLDYWETVHAGADQAAKDLKQKGINVNIEWKGMTSEQDVNGQIGLLEDFITKNVDGMAVAASDSKALVNVLQKAENAGIKVVTIDSGTDPQVSESFVATNNEAAAALAADDIAKITGGKGKVAVIPFVAGASTSVQREQGFDNELKKYPGLQLVATEYSNSDVNTALQVTENILTAHPDLSAIFAANEPGAVGAAEAVQARGLTGKVKVVAFDASPKEIEGVQNGSIQAMVVQDPFKIGYEGVMEVVDSLQGQPVQKQVDTGATVVTKDNMNQPDIQKLLYPLGKK